ncbi:4'-phosphopantetheinyl transferase superfamily protein, partial [Myxococcota bacterium]|nr:4'-phosphopantetheinyl transferase superfamily protein [Myxococcota bacterium]
DLQDVDARPETFHRRFDARVFAPEERARIAADGSGQTVSQARAEAGFQIRLPPHPQALRWAHWAAKEAAYKLMRQRDPAFVFSPIRLVARFDAPGTGRLPGSTRRGELEARAGDGSPPFAIELACFETGDFVHVVALPAGGDWSAVSTGIEALDDRRAQPDGDPSLAVRLLARREIARLLDLAPSRLAIGRRGRIPTLELDGSTTPLALSLSHHGRYVAYAVAKPARGLRLVRTGQARAQGGTRDGGPGRNETDDGEVAQAVGAKGHPGRRADAERKTG